MLKKLFLLLIATAAIVPFSGGQITANEEPGVTTDDVAWYGGYGWRGGWGGWRGYGGYPYWRGGYYYPYYRPYHYNYPYYYNQYRW